MEQFKGFRLTCLTVLFMDNNLQFSLAPMAGFTDLPFRRVCRRFGLYYAHTALIDAGALTYGNQESSSILARGADEPYLAVQLLGSIPEHIRVSAQLLRRMDFEALDFNMGCPVRKVLQRRAGAALMRDLENALTCLKILRDSTDKPLTVKTRILSETDPEPTLHFCQALAKIGIDGLTIHGRLASKVYSGPVAHAVIRAVREELKIPVSANGGIFSRADALRLAAETGCQRLMVARGAIGNPWIFRELLDEKQTKPSHREVCSLMFEHLEQMREFYGEERGMVIGRKIVQSYLVGRGYRRALRHQATQISSWQDFCQFHRLVSEEGCGG